MNLPDFVRLLDPAAHGPISVAIIGAFFPFLKKQEPETIDKGTLQTINKITCQFLEARGVENFKVYTIAYEDQPVVLIQAEPQKKLRFSNIIEIQIKNFIRDTLSIEVPAVFWRFKTDNSDTPGPEQADYEFEEPFLSPPTGDHIPQSSHQVEDASMEQESAFHLAPHLTLDNMQVEEVDISMGEFDEFLKGAANAQKKDQKP
ncbi:MAG: hypothetical protein LLG15_07565 [Betaproteobacteria bacterium]|nr:hypothetical protein [Betaproteobacteria bacterium]